ncbi:CDP-glycerol:poly(glycerophosphate) glycerophosphotransferase [Sediminihabitans luteus]|uniref:CDP-glycerol:poly(Glycerophosphate) glycerophosphotransferase n=1 Tax=Sediminihabitans luteus TaxID=1138585 RepID=A0A2M9CDI1_9CELL|nr:CDP-glycerol glycerophosphotransferase family protein [Sediminihabitans luteus]PJJ69996.1 CDP-glycerol:poly(glycerophosphate) glycerophosphotransferase [Sediminihabitans luteus]GII99317.1 glycosyl transferase [Sediminihabitans luteus]
MDLLSTARGARSRATSRVAAGLLRTGSWVRARLRAAATPRVPLDLSGRDAAPVAVFFTGGPHVRYQLLQWLPVLDELRTHHEVVIVAREPEDVAGLRTDIPVLVAPTLGDLHAVYEQLGVKVVLYPNNALGNFQSLVYRDALHVHVNHGESDKVSMVSNQAKAYDRVVVAGQAAVDRHARALLEFDVARLVVCGRPQLDLPRDPLLAAARPGVSTVLYAPTWTGEDASNNYTSVDVYGPTIVREALAGGFRVVYKPHPRVTTTQDPAVEAGHRAVLAAIEESRRDDPGRDSRVLLDGDVLGTFDGVDVLVADVSSVGLDFLYLRPDAPILLTDRRDDAAALRLAAPVSQVAHVVDATTVADVGTLLEQALEHDPHARERAAVRAYYFGSERGESLVRFREFVERCMDDRDVAVAGRDG